MATKITDHLVKRLTTTKLGKAPFTLEEAHESFKATIDGRKLLEKRKNGLFNIKCSLVVLVREEALVIDSEGRYHAQFEQDSAAA